MKVDVLIIYVFLFVEGKTLAWKKKYVIFIFICFLRERGWPESRSI